MTNPYILQSHPPIFLLTDWCILYHAFLSFVYSSVHLYVHVGRRLERSEGGDGVIEGKLLAWGGIGGEWRETGRGSRGSEFFHSWPPSKWEHRLSAMCCIEWGVTHCGWPYSRRAPVLIVTVIVHSHSSGSLMLRHLRRCARVVSGE